MSPVSTAMAAAWAVVIPVSVSFTGVPEKVLPSAVVDQKTLLLV